MEQQDNVRSAAYFRALLGGWNHFEAERIARGENAPAVSF